MNETIEYTCPHCNTVHDLPIEAMGTTIECPDCGQEIELPEIEIPEDPPPAPSPPPPQPKQRRPAQSAKPPPTEVVIKDVDIPFGSMVELLVTLVLAAIPAMIILTVIIGGVIAVIISLASL